MCFNEIAFLANPSFQVAHCRTQRQGAQCEIEASVMARDEEAGSNVRRPSWLVRICQILSRTMWICGSTHVKLREGRRDAHRGESESVSRDMVAGTCDANAGRSPASRPSSVVSQWCQMSNNTSSRLIFFSWCTGEP